jgi:putative endonuclease
MEQKRTVYILKNLQRPPRYYTGVTGNLRQRLDDHNQGRSPHTVLHRPWVVDVAIKFADERRAIAFEKYLKTGSGFAFAIRHLR